MEGIDTSLNVRGKKAWHTLSGARYMFDQPQRLRCNPLITPRANAFLELARQDRVLNGLAICIEAAMAAPSAPIPPMNGKKPQLVAGREITNRPTWKKTLYKSPRMSGIMWHWWLRSNNLSPYSSLLGLQLGLQVYTISPMKKYLYASWQKAQQIPIRRFRPSIYVRLPGPQKGTSGKGRLFGASTRAFLLILY